MPKIEQVWVVIPPGYIHTQSFIEIAHGFALALKATFVTDLSAVDWKKRTLVFGSNMLGGGTELPAGWVLYNGEQVWDGSPWFGASHYLRLLKTHEVWDYSALNVRELHRIGVEAECVAVGWYPEWPRLPEPASEGPYAIPGEGPIDVLFYGSMNPRRGRIIEMLRERGVDAQIVFGAYGEDRDRLIARSRIVLNVHYYPTQIFEIFRCSHLFANGVCVVSETGADLAMETPYRAGGGFVGYADLVDKCVDLLGDVERRKAVAEHGHRVFTSVKQADIIKRVVE